jgi:hypothetical protein
MAGDERKGNNSTSSVSWSVIGSIIVVTGVVIVGFNYWHAMKCIEMNGIEDSHEYISAMEKRVLDIENQVKLSHHKTQRLIQQLQEKVLILNDKKMTSLIESSKDQAIRTALLLQTLPAPPQTQYLVDDKTKLEGESKWDDLFEEFGEKDGMGLTQQYDDPLWQESEGLSEEFRQAENFEEFDDDHYKEGNKLSEGEQKIESSFQSQEAKNEQRKECQEWKEKYGVVTGVSWGELPYDLQIRWKDSNCDYYLSLL